jgi:hypothetical protein
MACVSLVDIFDVDIIYMYVFCKSGARSSMLLSVVCLLIFVVDGQSFDGHDVDGYTYVQLLISIPRGRQSMLSATCSTGIYTCS